MNKKALALASAALTVGFLAPTASAEATAQPTLAQVLLSDSAGDDANGFDRNWNDYDIVTQAVLAFPDLTAAVSDPSASLTVFLPDDASFRSLARKVLGRTPHTEKQAFDAVVSLGLPLVKDVLTYHIVGQKLPASAVVANLGTPISTLLGETITVVKKTNGTLSIVDKDTDSRNAYVVKPDLALASNGVAHGVNRVIRPIDL